MNFKKAFLLFFSSCALCCFPSHGIERIEDQSGLTISTPSLGERKISKIRLSNGLEALLISDPDTHQSGAAMAVETGSWDDPKSRPGMAHFVEHMLFLGTEKYPEEEEMQRYLDEHGGSRNAFTMSDRTVYMFSVNNEGLDGALDRFAQFFIAPLFLPSGIARECCAIDHEFSRNVPVDGWRIHYVKKELSNPDHPFHHFCIGNKDTLASTTSNELKEWYCSHYGSDRMHLVLVSDQSLDKMEAQVDALFSQVNRKCQKEVETKSLPLLSAQTAAKMVAITPLQDLQTLTLTWELPSELGADWQARPDEIASFIVGHEGENSLLAQLKKEELALALSAGTEREGRNQCLYQISIHLTKKGVAEIDKVIERCFQGIASFRKQELPRYIYDEIRQLKTLKYAYQERKIFLIMSLDLQLIWSMNL